MNKGKVLVTDSLFIYANHIKLIEDAGYEVVRLDNPSATEMELCEAIKGKVGYILGGVEQVTEKVIMAADKLKVISFTGAGYSEFIPAHKLATKKGIYITAAKGGNANAVAEFALTLCMMAIRAIPSLTHKKGSNFLTAKSCGECVLGIVGYGDIGKKMASIALSLGFSVLVHSRTEPINLPSEMRFVSLQDLLQEADVISLHVDKLNGNNVLNKDNIKFLKDGVNVVNVSFKEAVDIDAITKALRDEKIYYFADHTLDDIESFSVGRVVCTNSQTGYNTRHALNKVSNQTTKSLLSILETGRDEYLVN